MSRSPDPSPAPADYLSQARFWTGELPRRAGLEAVRRLPPRLFARTVAVLEAATRPRDLTLDPGFARVREIVAEVHCLAAAELVRTPPVPDIVDEDAYWHPPVRVHRLTGVRADVDSGLVFARGWVVNGTGNGNRWSTDTAFLTGAVGRIRRPRPTQVDGPVALAGELVRHYHFFLEALPAMLRARQAEPDVVFVTAQRPSAFASEVLAHAGVSLRPVRPGTVLTCTNLLLTQNVPRDRTHPADLRLVRDTLAPLASPRPFGERVYVSRAHGPRALRDEHRLEQFLRERGFAIVHLELLPLADQVASLAGARTVVAPHGAGLSKAVFMASGGTMIELATGELWTPAYQRIAAALGLDYRLELLPDVAAEEFGTASADDAIARLQPLLT